ncbi:hypothetical protein BN1002_02124 [Bacillus sp. B-jedd]|nr:hypothetical protein BN1002_02124 [Bacillus sp. B-jedd]
MRERNEKLGDMSVAEYIDTLIKEKLEETLQEKQLQTLKKKELETYLESLGKTNDYPYKKAASPFKTTYLFNYDRQKFQVEIFYRYTNFYTRHHVSCIAEESGNN